jgi:hypothetical protein
MSRYVCDLPLSTFSSSSPASSNDVDKNNNNSPFSLSILFRMVI